MPTFTPAQLTAARSLDLLTYLQNYEPDNLVQLNSHTWSTREHDSVRISNGLWYQFSRNIGGASALDYLVKVEGIPFADAVAQILYHEGIAVLVKAEPPPYKPPELKIPAAAPGSKRVFAYLCSRCIDPQIIAYCISAGLLYQTREYGNCAFVGKDPDGKIKLIDLRSTGNYVFKRMAPGSDRRFSFRITGKNPEQVHLFEGAIDALSYATLLKQQGKNWRNSTLLSLSGVYQPSHAEGKDSLPKALKQYLEEHPETKRVVLHLDTDEPGRLAAQSILAALPEGIEGIDLPVPEGKDVNEYLCTHCKPTRNREEAR